jgi:hypothetical protein
MTTVTIDAATGALVLAGKKVFPIGFSNPPPAGSRAPNGRDGLEELAAGGASFIRTGIANWTVELIQGQIANERARLDAAAAHGLHCWLWLGETANLPPPAPGKPPSVNERLLVQIVNALEGHPALGAYKGIDEPRNPFRGENWIRPAGLIRAYKKLKTLDADHPLVIIQAPRSTIAELTPYRPAFDISGADIYPVAYPPGRHSDTANRDISVVGDITAKMARAAGKKPIWMTLQIAWSGTTPSQQRPELVPRFPTLHEERFMAYQAIANGARGLYFFGGHLTQVTTPADAEAGWNWTFWQLVLKPLLAELGSSALQPALVAPNAKAAVVSTAKDVELVARRAAGFLYLIAVRRGNTTTTVGFSGLPSRNDGTPITAGEALFEYVQRPPPPPIQPGHQVFRPIKVASGAFRDWLGPHDARVYRFRL